jgi:cell division protein FtsN
VATLRIGTGQLVFLILGVLFVSVGGGMLGGRLVAEKSGAVATQRPMPAADGVDAAATVDAPPPQPAAEAEREPEEDAVPAEAEAGVAEPPAAAEIAPPEPSETAVAVSTARPVEEPVAPLEETPAPAPQAAPDAGLQYVIQAMSTSNQDDARAARKRIIAEGFSAGVFEANLPGRGRWYRVYVGPYETEADALSVLEAVRTIPGFSESFLKELK